MANTIGWGKATQNNTNGYGKYQNTIGAASVYEDSWAGDTVIVGTSAAFTYAKSSYHQDESDPTPTITGTAGGTFSGTSGIVFVDSGTNSGSSTGQVDLSASTIQANTITYTVLGISANFSLSVTASPFLVNTYSMEFDGVDDYIDCGTGLGDLLGNYSGDFTWSSWVNIVYAAAMKGIFYIGDYPNPNWTNSFEINHSSNTIFVRHNGNITSQVGLHGLGTWNNVWIHLTVTSVAGGTVTTYINGSVPTPISSSNAPASINFSSQTTIIGDYLHGLYKFDGKIDEVAFWNTELSSDAITEIYNATNNNSGKALDLTTSSGNYSSADASALQYFNRMGD